MIESPLQAIGALAPKLHIDELRTILALTAAALKKETSTVEATPAELAKTTGLTEAEAQRALTSLAKRGIITTAKNHHEIGLSSEGWHR